MIKNWMIRTNSCQILGPITKKKVRELYESGSIQDDDELCMGSGFWFFVREKEMIDRFLLGDEVQDFNPVCDIEDSFNTGTQTDDTAFIQRADISSSSARGVGSGSVASVEMPTEIDDFDGVLPSPEDLEYPTNDALEKMMESKEKKAKRVRREDIMSKVNSEQILEKRRKRKLGTHTSAPSEVLDQQNSDSKSKFKSILLIFIFVAIMTAVIINYQKVLGFFSKFLRSQTVSAQQYSEMTQKKSPLYRHQ